MNGEKKLPQKFDVVFEENIANVFWDSEFIDFLENIKSEDVGNSKKFNDSFFYVDEVEGKRHLILAVFARINSELTRFMFYIPLSSEKKSDMSDLDRGLCYINHTMFMADQLYSVSGKYLISSNTLSVNKVQAVK